MTGLIILAAGSSSRLGQPKQKLIYKGRSLLQHAVEEGLASPCSPIVVVLGANEESLHSEINYPNILHVTNYEWESGMSSSIKCGLEFMLKNGPAISQAIIMLCDQPFVDAEILNRLIEAKQQSGKLIAACTYDTTLGTPALFDKEVFSELLSLDGQQGAKKLVFDHSDQVEPVPFPLGNIDIDTVEDYEKLKAITF
jgi:molybdenum cofactor cytidylyltransferase